MKRFLIIEDEFIIVKDLKLLLEKNKASVTIARNYEEAVEFFDPDRFDLIICDINLNDDKDGIDTIATLMEKGTVPVVYLTAYDSKDIVDRAMQTMPFAYLLKPYNEAQLKITIDLACLNYKKQREAVEEQPEYTSKIEELTNREKEILVALASGKTSKETGDSLSISPHTVEQHKKNIKRKLNMHTLNELVRFTMASNLFQIA